MKSARRPQRRAAFTLLELMTVTAIVGVLAALSMPIYQHVTESGHAVACLSNLRQIGAALNLYLGDHNLTLPTLNAGRTSLSENVPTIDNTLDAYTQSHAVFTCPADAAPGGHAAKSGTSYFWNSALNGQALAALSFFNISATSRIPLLFDKDHFHPYEPNKMNFLYADGHSAKELKLTPGP